MVPFRPSTIIRSVLALAAILYVYDVGRSQFYKSETAALLRGQGKVSPPEPGLHVADQTDVFKISPRREYLTSLIVSAEALATGDDQGIVESNFSIVDSLRDSKVPESEINRAALESRYVDFFYGAMVDGGFEQFVDYSEWDSETVALVRKGLIDLKAFQHLALFDEGVAIVAGLDPDELRQFINASHHNSKDSLLVKLSSIDRRFYDLNDRESLVKLNAAWIRQQPNLIALSPEALRDELQGRGVYLPHRDKIPAKT
ncbi:hypothetical protein HB774_30705 (plasmid) [Rhizobium leguminosarum bv. viciae]|nr:hypothetical protein HB774_30705 [Rhizobium leguminosarum bv. viciae]